MSKKCLFLNENNTLFMMTVQLNMHKETKTREKIRFFLSVQIREQIMSAGCG